MAVSASGIEQALAAEHSGAGRDARAVPRARRRRPLARLRARAVRRRAARAVSAGWSSAASSTSADCSSSARAALGVWGPMIGQEAAQAGLGLAMQPGDWIFPSYREAIVAAACAAWT